jgi:hypothetical protein
MTSRLCTASMLSVLWSKRSAPLAAVKERGCRPAFRWLRRRSAGAERCALAAVFRQSESVAVDEPGELVGGLVALAQGGRWS